MCRCTAYAWCFCLCLCCINALQVLQQTRCLPRPIVHTQVVKKSRVWALSDLHCDNHSNLRWIEAWPTRKNDNAFDVLIVAGDISSKIEVLQKTLSVLQTKYDDVLFVPGNHELWVSSRTAKLDRCSIQKFLDVMALCKVHLMVCYISKQYIYIRDCVLSDAAVIYLLPYACLRTISCCADRALLVLMYQCCIATVCLRCCRP
jgi:hypothetical protein